MTAAEEIVQLKKELAAERAKTASLEGELASGKRPTETDSEHIKSALTSRLRRLILYS